MKVKIIIGILITFIIAIVFGIKQYNKPHIDVSKITANYKLSTNELIKEFIIDENVADKKFANKIVEINGIILEIVTTNGKAIITLIGEEANIICQLNEKENKKIMQLKKDQNITIKGQCSGYLMDIILVNCIIK